MRKLPSSVLTSRTRRYNFSATQKSLLSPFNSSWALCKCWKLQKTLEEWKSIFQYDLSSNNSNAPWMATVKPSSKRSRMLFWKRHISKHSLYRFDLTCQPDTHWFSEALFYWVLISLHWKVLSNTSQYCNFHGFITHKITECCAAPPPTKEKEFSSAWHDLLQCQSVSVCSKWGLRFSAMSFALINDLAIAAPTPFWT